MALSPQDIINEIVTCCSKLTAGKRVWVAYSGGIDSHVLLHILAQSSHPQLENVAAIHVDHGLHKDSNVWSRHCADIAAGLNIEFIALQAEVSNIESLGMEAAAREARYQALQHALTANDVLLTAQHQEDQAETLLLQLFRGAGPKGLSGMAGQFTLGETHTFRPLLNVSQTEIVDYAITYQLDWIDDPSNVETRWNRNYIRHKLWPDIIERWPSAAKTLSRSAALCAETTELLDELAEQDLGLLDVDGTTASLSISPLLELSLARCRNALRHFITQQKLALPSRINLQRIIDEVCLAKQDSNPIVAWSGVEVRRYQQRLYFMKPLSLHDTDTVIKVNDFENLSLQDGRVIEWVNFKQKETKALSISAEITLRFRQGGEKIKPQGEAHHKSLKHLFQQWCIPPWQRDRIPLIFCDDKLVAVIGYCISDSYTVNDGHRGYIPQFKV